MRNRGRACCTSLLLLLWATRAYAQQHSFTQVSTKDGLAQSQVRTIAQDAQGYLWFGTLGGASRFDGREFVNYALTDGLPDPQVSAMVLDKKGTLFLGSGGTLAMWNVTTLRSEVLPASSHGTRILGLAADEHGRVFIGTDGGGMFLRDSTGIRPLPGYPVDTASSVRSVLGLTD